MEQYKNHALFVVLCVGFLLLFTKPLVLVCALIVFGVIQFNRMGGNQKQDGEENVQPAEKSPEREAPTMGFDTSEEEEIISQKDIDSLLNSEQAEDEIDPFDPEKNSFK
jgi:hypothetical protein